MDKQERTMFDRLMVTLSSADGTYNADYLYAGGQWWAYEAKDYVEYDEADTYA